MRAVVTGASSGIGAAFAYALSARGYEVVLVGRDRDRLGTVAAGLPGPSDVVVADLTQDAGLRSVEAVLRDAPVDLLVNNAAAGTHGPFAEQDPVALSDTVALNVTAVVRLSRAALDAMLPRGRGGLITLSSLSTTTPHPGMATYSATKAFVDSWTSSVREELRGSGVTLTCVRPGWVRTGFHASSGQSVGHVPDGDWVEPGAVATRALDAYDRGEESVVVLPELSAVQSAVRAARTRLRRVPVLRAARNRLRSRSTAPTAAGRPPDRQD